MLIGELSKRSGFSRDTIRFYEKQGLIRVGRRERRENNYKEYSEDILRQLLLLRKIKSYGFTLNESAGIIALMEENLATCNRVSEAASGKIQTINARIQELENLKELLQSGVDACMSGCCSPDTDENCRLFAI
ncbi:MerR family transcriptional regulator [Chitinophaga alhagiae]|uniref:MerR family transcriptional regulator n=1 Tax=Chitinophaga alhagiae TaxID=2203219 RepID=UPI0013006B1F|nr:MerR family transcriptional regulator [Chitinophaga alhagiae]